MALASLPRSPSEASSSCVLVVGTERSVVLVDSLTFNAVRKVLRLSKSNAHAVYSSFA